MCLLTSLQCGKTDGFSVVQASSDHDYILYSLLNDDTLRKSWAL